MTVAEVLGKDYTGKTYNGNLILKNKGLTSLKGSPEVVNGDFDCSNNELKTLKYAPKIVKGIFCCDHNKLTSLRYSPVEASISFSCSWNKIKSLKYSPKIVGYSFYCNNNYLKNLEHSPISDKFGGSSLEDKHTTFFKGSYDCSSNKLISLKGAPDFVGGYFDCSNNNELRSLKYSPKNIGWSFICTDCDNLTDIDFEFEKIEDNVVMHNNNSLTLLQKLYFLFKNVNKIDGDILFYEEDDNNLTNTLLKKINKAIKGNKTQKDLIKLILKDEK